VLCIRLGSITDKVSLITFDVGTIQRFGFETINQQHLDILKTLKCEGKDTALFRSIQYCLDKFEKLSSEFGEAAPPQYLFVLTDGANNVKMNGALENDRSKTRSLSDRLKYNFQHFNGGNATMNSLGH
jgi:hypothetical protein